MHKWMTALLVGVSLVMASALSVLSAQQSGALDKGMLTTADYLEIQQLYSRYNHFIDSGKDNGYAYARLFTSDGVFETTVAGTHQGHDALARFAMGVAGVTEVRPNHMAYNVMIDPSPEGAVGSAYFIMMRPGEPGQPAAMGTRGIYNDRFVKTAEGWRFQYRKFTPAGAEVPPSDQ